MRACRWQRRAKSLALVATARAAGRESDCGRRPRHPRSTVTFWQILGKITRPSILWGLGTAIGEMPPYFIARAARQAGERLQELEVDRSDAAPSLLDRCARGMVPSSSAGRGGRGRRGGARHTPAAG